MILVNEKRQAGATAKNSRAIKALVVAQATAVRKLTTQQLKSDRDLSKRLVEGHTRLEKRITKELSGGTGSLDKHGKRMMRMLKRQRQRSIWNSVLLASSAPFFAAYGDRSDPFGRNNLILTGSLLAWLLGDELIDQFSGKSEALKSGASVWSYLAPIGNGATAFFLLKDGQYERFLTGIDTLGGAGTAVDIDLTSKIGSSAVEDFKKTKHAVVASSVDADPTKLTAVVANGVLTLKSDVANVKVAWIVDTFPLE